VVFSQIKAQGVANVTYHLVPDPTKYVDRLRDMHNSSVDFKLVDGLEHDRLDREVCRLPSRGPGDFFAWETTVCVWK
jgi:hypothetical protein